MISGSAIFRATRSGSAAAVWYANEAGGMPTSRVVRSRATMAWGGGSLNTRMSVSSPAIEA